MSGRMRSAGLFLVIAVHATAGAEADLSPRPVPIDPVTAEVSLQFDLPHDITRLFSATEGSPRFLTSGTDGRIMVWPVGAVRPEREIETGGRRLVAASLVPGRFCCLIVSQESSEVVIWSLLSNKETKRIQNGVPVIDLVVSPGGNRFACRLKDGTVRIFDAEGNPDEHLGKDVVRDARSMAFSGDGRHLAVGTSGGQVVLWNAGERTTKEYSVSSSEIRSLSFHPNGEVLAVGADGAESRGGGLHLLNLLHDRPGPSFSFDGRTLLRVVFSPCGRRIVAGGSRGGMWIWDVKGGAPLKKVDVHFGSLLGLWFPPGGSVMVTVDRNGTLRVWES